MRAGVLLITALENPALELSGGARWNNLPAMIRPSYITPCTVIIASEAEQICHHKKPIGMIWT